MTKVFSIHAPRMESDGMLFVNTICHPQISIHAPRMESDYFLARQRQYLRNFNSRSPHEERPAANTGCFFPYAFQFTLPAWRATSAYYRLLHGLEISIHAPRMESDIPKYTALSAASTFQFTLPAWRATCKLPAATVSLQISIHAPRMESDGGRISL